MQRTLLPLVLIVLVLLGAWMIWPQAEPRAPANPSPDATETLPVRPAAGDAEVEAVPAAERAPETTAPVPAAAATILSVQCVSRTDKRPLAGVHVRATGIGEQVTAGNGCTFLEVQPGRALAVSADDFEHFVSLETAEVPALAAGETRQLRLEHDVGEHAHFCGLVVARDGGAPVAGTEVRVGEDLRTSTDAQGRFEIDYASLDRATRTPSTRGASSSGARRAW